MKIRNTLLVGLCLTFAALGPAQAADAAPAKQLTAPQQRMSDCSKEATTKKLSSTQRREFMRTCMHGDAMAATPAKAAAAAKPGEAPKMTPQERMKQCNKDAAGKKGPERRAFMSECLKAK